MDKSEIEKRRRRFLANDAAQILLELGWAVETVSLILPVNKPNLKRANKVIEDRKAQSVALASKLGLNSRAQYAFKELQITTLDEAKERFYQMKLLPNVGRSTLMQIKDSLGMT